MTLLLPLGLLGLVSLLILLLIYILRPNYQQKLVSTTFIWKLSLKYKKHRIPISRLRNILLIICQLLLLAVLAFMLSQPVLGYRANLSENEKIAIIDASANMQMKTDNQTRIDRAVTQVQLLADETFSHEDGVLTVIVADRQAHLLFSRYTSENNEEVYSLLTQLRASFSQSSDSESVWYGSADIEGASKLAEEVLKVNSSAQVMLYTCTKYVDTDIYTVVDVSHPDDRNVAILDVDAVFGDSNTYSFDVTVGCYGQNKPVEVVCEVIGANGVVTSTRKAVKTEYFSEAESEKTVTFTTDDFAGGGAIYSYQQVYVYVEEQDSFQSDNFFNVYGGTKPTINIQYSSGSANKFYRGVLGRFRENFKNKWNIVLDIVSPEEAATTGYDLYVFEHVMPDVTPTDGVVIFSNPDKAPEGCGFELGTTYSVDSSSTLANGQPHPITEYTDASAVTIAKYTRIIPNDDYKELYYFNGDPVLLVKEQPDSKIVVLAIDLNNSNFSMTPYFSAMMFNLFNYFIPSTLSDYSFDVGQSISLNARGENMYVTVPGVAGQVTFDSVPATMLLTVPGDYTVAQTDMSNTPVVEQFFVRIPYKESNISHTEDRLPALQTQDTSVVVLQDLSIWFAAAALLLLAVEWLLHSRENI